MPISMDAYDSSIGTASKKGMAWDCLPICGGILLSLPACGDILFKVLGCLHQVIIFDDEYKIVFSNILSCAQQKFSLRNQWHFCFWFQFSAGFTSYGTNSTLFLKFRNCCTNLVSDTNILQAVTSFCQQFLVSDNNFWWQEAKYWWNTQNSGLCRHPTMLKNIAGLYGALLLLWCWWKHPTKFSTMLYRINV